MAIEDFLFSAAGGFLFGALAGYAIKKVMKIAAVVVGLFVAGLAFLTYKGWIDVKWTGMEISTRSTLENVTTQLMHTVNNTASQFATHSYTIAASGLPLAAGIGFVPGLMFGGYMSTICWLYYTILYRTHTPFGFFRCIKRVFVLFFSIFQIH